MKKGDICVVRAALRKVGDVDGKRSAVIVDALLDTVGEQGTIVTLTFTSNYRLPIDPNNPKYVFTKDTPPYSGGLARECLSRPDAVRSKHPTNSFCAIGKDAHFILDQHDETSSCFEPIGKTIEKKGKMLLIGCIDVSPGFTTVHWAQWLLGLSTKTRKKNKTGVYYFDEDGKKKLFINDDTGGCSMGFFKFYDHYRKAGILSEGMVGDAPSMLIDGEKALAVEMPLIKKDPRFPFCDNPACKICRISWEFSDTSPFLFWIKHPKFLLYEIKNKLKG